MEITLGFSIMVEGMEEPSFIINLKKEKNCCTTDMQEKNKTKNRKLYQT